MNKDKQYTISFVNPARMNNPGSFIHQFCMNQISNPKKTNIMKGKDLLLSVVVSMFMVPLFFTSCEEDGNNTSTKDTIVSIDSIYSSDTIFSIDTVYSSDTVYLAEENVFMLEFSHSADPDDNELDVYFAMNSNNISQIPEVEVNGTTIKDFNLFRNTLTGNMEIPYGKSIQYSVSQGDSTTSGTIIMPEIAEATVNGYDLLIDAYDLQIPEATTYDVYYEFDDADYTRISKYNDDPWMDEKVWNITSSSYSLSIDTTDVEVNFDGNHEVELYRMNFSTAKGIGPYESSLGLNPNISGEFGSGYLSAFESHSPVRVEMDPSLKSASSGDSRDKRRRNDRGLSKKEFAKAYRETIKNAFE